MKQAKSQKKSMRRCLLAAILPSVALPAGILMIIFGATGQRYVLMTFGIVFTVARSSRYAHGLGAVRFLFPAQGDRGRGGRRAL